MSKFIAAMDNSGGSAGGVLDLYGQDWNDDNKMQRIHEYRLRMINAPEFTNDKIWAGIVYVDSVHRGVVDALGKKGIETYLKIDSGCEANGTLKQFLVDEMLSIATKSGCTGTKMRSVVKDINDINEILDQQFELADKIIAAGLTPIVEPEVPIEHINKESVEAVLYYGIAERLDDLKGQCILKLTLPEKPNFYDAFLDHNNVKDVVALSGGYSLEECERRLATQGMGASFSRALAEDLQYSMSANDFNNTIGRNINRISKAVSK